MTVKTAVVVDPDPRWLEAVERLLRVNGVDVLGCTSSFAEAEAIIEQGRPELAIVDLAATDREPFAWLRERRQEQPAMQTIVFCGRRDPRSIEAALSAGAVAYVVKQADLAEIADALRGLEQRSAGRRAQLALVANGDQTAAGTGN
jgi:DNA-binding response OmpR family regulator